MEKRENANSNSIKGVLPQIWKTESGIERLRRFLKRSSLTVADMKELHTLLNESVEKFQEAERFAETSSMDLDKVKNLAENEISPETEEFLKSLPEINEKAEGMRKEISDANIRIAEVVLNWLQLGKVPKSSFVETKANRSLPNFVVSVEKLHDNYRLASESLISVSRDLANIKLERNEEKDKLNELIKETKALEAQKQDSEQTLNKYEKEIKDKSAVKRKLKEEIQKLNQEKKWLEEAKKEMKQDMEKQLLKIKENIESNIQEASTKISKFIEKTVELKDVVVLKSKIPNQQIKSRTLELKDLKQEIIEVKASLKTTKNKISEAEDKCKEKDKEIVNLKHNKEILEKQTEHLLKENHELEATRKAHEKEVENLRNEIRTLQIAHELMQFS